MEGLSLYAWTIAGGTALGCALAIAGCHLATRGRTLQALCVSQGAELGALASVLWVLLQGEHLEDASAWMSLIGAIGGAALCGMLAKQSNKVRASSRTSFIFTLWLLLLSATHLSVALHPLLESHLSRVFLGDLATVSNQEALFAFIFALGILIYFSAAQSAILRRSFDAAVLMRKEMRDSWQEELVFLLLAAFSTWSMGFLFTCACLFIPTSILGAFAMTNALKHVLYCALIPLIAVPPAIAISLGEGNIPTVPAVAVLMMFLTVMFLGMGFLRKAWMAK